ncbi:MAG TPA: HAMP domain-containing sensor histidine kinase [Polyangiaceae bacterium]|nr:HAMP domain-containing sensor histidine kinase [Polyangiaceae bacterium]
MKRAPRTGLVWRLYAVGLAQFSLVVLSAIVIGYLLTRFPQRWDMVALSARLKPFANDRVALAHELQELRARERLMVSLYDEEGKLLVSNVVPALRAPRLATLPEWPPAAPAGEGQAPDMNGPPFGSAPDGPPLFGARPRQFGGPEGEPRPPDTFGRFEMNGLECLLIARFEHQRPGRLPLILTMVSGLLVLGVGAFLTARWIARPLSHLSRMATSLGRGDLSVRSELQRNDELGDVGRAFDEMAERIQRLLQTEKELLANVAHELRTPLARIRVALEIAGEGDAEAARASLAEIAVDLAELEALINDVLTAARFELAEGLAPSSGFALHLQELAPQAIAERSADLFRGRHPSRPLSKNFSDVSRVIQADPVLLRRVLDNLLENAHKYSPEADSSISLSVSEHAGQACFEVRDQGMGISDHDLPLVFTAFFRGERSRSRGTGGVGLGLTLAKRIVEAHGGRIEVESVIGRGSTFRAYLPLLSRGETADDRHLPVEDVK